MIVKINKLSLTYPVYNFEKSLRKKIISSKSENIKYVNALKDINLIVSKNDRIGLLGRNGSGKTSLLKVIAGIYYPSSGSIEIYKKPFCMFDSEMGLNSEATGIENINFIGHLRGIKNFGTQNIINKIVDFSELEKFIHYPLRTYSSGMKVRLATSIALYLKPELLLIDEFFGTGDKYFREKAKKSFENNLGNLSGMFLASHDEKLIYSICNRVLTLENGMIVSDKKLN